MTERKASSLPNLCHSHKYIVTQVHTLNYAIKTLNGQTVSPKFTHTHRGEKKEKSYQLPYPLSHPGEVVLREGGRRSSGYPLLLPDQGASAGTIKVVCTHRFIRLLLPQELKVSRLGNGK